MKNNKHHTRMIGASIFVLWLFFSLAFRGLPDKSYEGVNKKDEGLQARFSHNQLIRKFF
jgi:hypothetical protein